MGYSGVSDMAGGQLFYDNTTKAYTTTKIGNAFSIMDGLSRDERVRYDTPFLIIFQRQHPIPRMGEGISHLDMALKSEELNWLTRLLTQIPDQPPIRQITRSARLYLHFTIAVSA